MTPYPDLDSVRRFTLHQQFGPHYVLIRWYHGAISGGIPKEQYFGVPVGVDRPEERNLDPNGPIFTKPCESLSFSVHNLVAVEKRYPDIAERFFAYLTHSSSCLIVDGADPAGEVAKIQNWLPKAFAHGRQYLGI